MILYFKAATYKSIKEELTINFNASSIGEHQESNVIEQDKLKLLRPVSAIMQVWKNLLRYSRRYPFAGILYFATEAASESADRRWAVRASFSTINRPFVLWGGFTLGKYKYRYGFEADKEQVHKEWLLNPNLKKSIRYF